MTDSINNTLKPCPFCGVEPNIHTKNYGDEQYVIRCSNANNCGTVIITGLDVDHVASKWNTRHE